MAALLRLLVSIFQFLRNFVQFHSIDIAKSREENLFAQCSSRWGQAPQKNETYVTTSNRLQTQANNAIISFQKYFPYDKIISIACFVAHNKKKVREMYIACFVMAAAAAFKAHCSKNRLLIDRTVVHIISVENLQMPEEKKIVHFPQIRHQQYTRHCCNNNQTTHILSSLSPPLFFFIRFFFFSILCHSSLDFFFHFKFHFCFVPIRLFSSFSFACFV